MKGFLAAIDGYKTYIFVAMLFVLVVATGGDPNSHDWSAAFRDPEVLKQELLVLIIASGRSALGKLIAKLGS